MFGPHPKPVRRRVHNRPLGSRKSLSRRYPFIPAFALISSAALIPTRRNVRVEFPTLGIVLVLLVPVSPAVQAPFRPSMLSLGWGSPIQVGGDNISWASSSELAVDGNGYITSVWQQSDGLDRKSTRLNSSHDQISYAVFCLKKK